MKLDKKLGQYDVKNKLLDHMDALLKLKKGERPFPFSISIHITNVCNHKCNFCEGTEYLANDRNTLKTEYVKKLLVELKEMGVKSISWTGGGEPLAHPDFYEILDYSHSLGLVNGLITNFSLLKLEKIPQLVEQLVWLRISFNAGNRETYKLIHCVDNFEKVVNNIRQLTDYNLKNNKKLQISTSTVYKKDNIDSVKDLVKLAVSLNLDSIHLRPDQFLRDLFWLRSASSLLEDARQIVQESGSNLKITTSEYLEKQFVDKYPDKCYAHFFSLSIIASGNVSFCRSRFDRSDSYCGNIKESSMKEIWDSEKTRKLQNEIKPKDCAGFCRQMHVNVHADSLINIPEELNTDFI